MAINECSLLFQETLTLNLTDNTVNNEIYANNFKGELQGKDQFGKFALVSKFSKNVELIVKQWNMLSAENGKQKSINEGLSFIHFATIKMAKLCCLCSCVVLMILLILIIL